ncbi:MAG: potassium/proton antiporter [Acidobacteria bacterium]|nr:potassium/proton antiporter [Acidobacteriota bacterium]
MFLVDRLVLLAAVLLLIGTVSSKLSARLGLPVLVALVAIGMLAGENGIGIAFDNFVVAHAVGTVALAIILFDGGLQTRASALREVWKPSLLLATIGVLVTAAITGVAAAWIFDLPLVPGLLLGSIVASTDAAAVFSVLRSQGVHLRERVSATLEIESGSNDPMAVLLTIGFLEVLTGQMTLGAGMVGLFARQMGIGALAGLGCGWAAVRLINRINLATPGLYPVLALACGLSAFGAAALFGGSGFLAIYIAGIVVGNSRIVFQSGTFRFMDGLAWIGQITMFVALGLLSTPADLAQVAGPSLLLAAIQILIARPLAVVPLLLPFGFTVREQILISWVGLKGAVPIVLATFPLMFGIPEARLLFNVVFFVVLVSATLQGWTLPPVATRLGLQEAASPAPPAVLELLALRNLNAEIIAYTIAPTAAAAGRTLRELRMPEGALVGLVSRDGRLIAPRGSTRLEPGDYLFVIAQTAARAGVEKVFSAPATGASG